MIIKIVRFSFLFFSILILLDGRTGAYSSVDSIEYAKTILLENKHILKALFIPDKEPNAKKVLLGIINHEQESIYLAQFILNDKEIAEALCSAFDRGVKIITIFDEGSFNYRNEKITMLKNKGIDILFYKKRYSIMHNKFYIFGKNLNNKPLVFTGSANATYSGFKKNQENVIISDDALIVEQFKEKFMALHEEILEAKSVIKRLASEGLKEIIEKSKKIEFKQVTKEVLRVVPK